MGRIAQYKNDRNKYNSVEVCFCTGLIKCGVGSVQCPWPSPLPVFSARESLARLRPSFNSSLRYVHDWYVYIGIYCVLNCVCWVDTFNDNMYTPKSYSTYTQSNKTFHALLYFLSLSLFAALFSVSLVERVCSGTSQRSFEPFTM